VQTHQASALDAKRINQRLLHERHRRWLRCEELKLARCLPNKHLQPIHHLRAYTYEQHMQTRVE
jgi:hypothetical protein